MLNVRPLLTHIMRASQVNTFCVSQFHRSGWILVNLVSRHGCNGMGRNV